MNTYNINNVLEDFNKLVDLYLSSSSDEEKKNIYSQMLFIYNIDPKLAKGSKLFSYKPKNYNAYLKKKEQSKKMEYAKLDSLTRHICFNLWEEINKYYPLYTSIIFDNSYDYKNYANILECFFKKNFPKDLDLFQNDIRQNNLIIKKGFLFSCANIFYLESLSKYYINIEYYGKLNAFNMASTIHEYGHASTFMQNSTYNSKNYILNEVISSLYELLFLDYYLQMYGNEYNREEIIRLFNTTCIDRLKSSLPNRSEYRIRHIDMIESLYGQLIAATIYIKYCDKDLYDKIKLLKDNYSKVDGFELLRSIDITTDDLIDTSEDISKLVLRR